MTSSLIVGPLISIFIELLKRLPFIPVVAGQTVRIRAIAAVLSFIGSFIDAVMTGNVEALQVMVGTVLNYVLTWITHQSVFRNPHKVVVAVQ